MHQGTDFRWTRQALQSPLPTQATAWLQPELLSSKQGATAEILAAMKTGAPQSIGRVVRLVVQVGPNRSSALRASAEAAHQRPAKHALDQEMSCVTCKTGRAGANPWHGL